jgi:hypothetical protein
MRNSVAIVVVTLFFLLILQACSVHNLSIPLHPSIRHVVAEEAKPMCAGSVLVMNGADLLQNEFIIKNEGIGPDWVLPKGALASSTTTAFGAVYLGGCDIKPSNAKSYLFSIEPTVEAFFKISSFSDTLDIKVNGAIKIYDENQNIIQTRQFAYSELTDCVDDRQVDRVILMALLNAAKATCP